MLKFTNAVATHTRVVLGLLFLLSAPCLLHAKQLAIVSDKANAATNLNAADLASIFNARMRT